MAGPYAETCIVMEFETGSPKQFLRIEPDRPSGDCWLHDREEFDRSASREAVVEEYALPESDEYAVGLVTVPAGERLQIGDVAGTADREGGGNLVELLSRDRVPEDWVDETTTLAAFLE